MRARTLELVTRRWPVALWIVAAGLVVAVAQGNFADAEVTVTHVAGPVHMVVGVGGNIGVSIGDDGVLMVDSQFAPLADKIRAAIEKAGGGAPRIVVNTHWHRDHTGGNPAFSSAWSSPSSGNRT